MKEADLQGFGDAARRAVARAEAEARELGHGRVGTEHLLLGLLADVGSEGATLLSEAGVTLAAARHKVTEAVGRSAGAPPADGAPLALTARAARAVGRSRRFGHARRAQAVGSEHLLLGVLDVEGTAGQVLRGLGVDVDRLRAPLQDLDHGAEPSAAAGDRAAGDRAAGDAAVDDLAAAHPPPATGEAGASCPGCGADLGGELRYQAVTAIGAHGPRPATAYSCGACGRFLGVASA